MARKPTILLQTDFGLTCGYPGVVYGIFKLVDPELEIYDFNHYIRQFDIADGARSLLAVIDYWPKGTIFMSVVDPGVGTKRRSCVAKLDNGSYLVTPDNGTLTFLIPRIVEVREIDESINRLPGSENHHTFHARDVYAYTAARLASGIITYEKVGPAYPVEDCVILALSKGTVTDGCGEGEISDGDTHFGSVSFNFGVEEVREMGLSIGSVAHVTIRKDNQVLFSGEVPCQKTFGDVPIGAPLITIEDSGKHFGISLNQRSFVHTYLPHLFDPGEQLGDYKVSIKKIS